MLKLMIVDDEPFVRKALCQAVDWKKQGHLVAADCRNGREALDMMETVQPDVVITDVRMPFMNGVELAEKLHCRYPDTLVIMLSGYEEFEYAKVAVDYGVFAYLLKPLDVEELLETLRRAEREVKKRKQLKNFRVTDKVIYEEVLRGIFRYDKYEEEEEELLQELDEMYHAVVIVYASKEEAAAEVDKYLFSLSGEQSCLYLPGITKNFLYLLKSRSLKKLQKEREIFCERVLQRLKELELTSFCVTASSVKKGLEELMAALFEAENIEKMRYLIEDKAVYYADMKYMIRYTDLNMEVGSMVAVILRKNREEIYRELNRQFKKFEEDRISVYQVKDFAKAVILQLMAKIDAMDFNEQMGDYIVKLYSSSDLSTIKETLEIFSSESLNYFNRTAELTTNAMLTMAKEYMSKNFQNPELSLSEVAEYVHLNPSYFSAVFSKYCKVTFINYLAQLRIQNAQEKLVYTDERIVQIAVESGYANITYFCRNFKKVTGLSPKEYRNVKRRE